MSGATLEIDNVSVARSGRKVVHDVSIVAPPGEVTALLGPNGAGKSSLALAISGLLRTAAGQVRVDGRVVTGHRPEHVRTMGVSVVPEGRRMLTELSVHDNLKVATFGLDRTAAADGMRDALALLPELDKLLDRPANALSGGEQQMLVLAQALVSRPKVLLVDELSLGLAPIVVKRLVPRLAAVAEQGVAVLLIEQFAHIALSIASRAYVMEGGRVRHEGTAAELREHPELLHSAYLLGGKSSA